MKAVMQWGRTQISDSLRFHDFGGNEDLDVITIVFWLEAVTGSTVNLCGKISAQIAGRQESRNVGPTMFPSDSYLLF